MKIAAKEIPTETLEPLWCLQRLSGIEAKAGGSPYNMEQIARAALTYCKMAGIEQFYPECPECHELLSSHAGRGHKWFHGWAFGPYDGSSSGKCSLDGMAFEKDSTPIDGSDSARAGLARALHGDKPGFKEPKVRGE